MIDAISSGMIISMITSRIMKTGVSMESFLNSLICAPRLTTDVTNIQNAYQMILRMAMRAPASMIIAMVMAVTIIRGILMTTSFSAFKNIL